jgi:catechol 2,3-dioxygenase-like lactoylglutathione lyase family enzyme
MVKVTRRKSLIPVVSPDEGRHAIGNPRFVENVSAPKLVRVKPPATDWEGDDMEKVLGIGGFFFRGKDQGALRAWYATHLGIAPTPTDYEMPCWRTNGGATVFEPFAQDTTYFGSPAQHWMVNFRVRDLDAMIAQLTHAGIDVTRGEDAPNGRFARLHDPEGNPIELWEPAGGPAEMEEPV